MRSMRVALFVVTFGFWAAAAVGAERAQAGDAVTTREVLDGWAEALGGRERLAEISAVKRTYDGKMFNLDGTLEIWSSSRGETHVLVEVPGVFRVVQVFDGKQGWDLDQNGAVNEVTGESLADRVNGAYLESYSHLLEGRRAGTVEYLGVDEETGLHRVRCLPDGGEEVTFHLDPNTFLPVRSLNPHNDRTMTLTYSDWTDYDGVRFAREFKQSTGNVQHDATFTLRTVEFADEAPAGLFARPEPVEEQTTFTAAGSSVELDIELNGEHLFVPVSVNGSGPLWFIFDTGAGTSCLEMETAQELGLDMQGEIEARGAGEGSVTARFVSGVQFDIAGVALETERAIAIPFASLESKFGRRVDGILGHDYIGQFVFTIDYESKRMTIHDPARFDYAGSGAVVPIRIEHGHPHLQATVTPQGREPIETEFLVDTGAGGAVGFTRPFVEEHDLLATLPKKVLFTGAGGVGGKTKSYLGRIERIEIGGYALENPVCSFSQDQSGAGADRQSAGLIGGQVLSRFIVTIDYPSRRMIFEPQPDYKRAFRQNWTGLSFESGGRGDWHSFQVWDVTPASPGARAGIEIGDELIAIDGRDASEFTVHSLREYLLNREGTTQLVCRRNGEEFVREIPLDPYF